VVQAHFLDGQQLTVLLAILGSGAGAAAAMFAAVVATLSGDRRAGWTSAAIAVYGFVAIPAAVRRLQRTRAERTALGDPSKGGALPPG
jgi:hypothetical protein